MRLFQRAILFYSMLLIVSLIIQSCCNSDYKITGDGQLRAYQLDYVEIDTVQSEFMLISYFDAEVVGMMDEFSIIPTAYALSCDYYYINSLDKSTAQLTLDKDVILNGDTLIAGTNFIDMDGIEFEKGPSYDAHMDIKLTQVFLDQVVFKKEAYTFKVNISTDDGFDLENSVVLEMDL